MRRLSLCLDSLPALREISGLGRLDLAAAASLAELAGVDALRFGVADALQPVTEADVRALRQVARSMELRMPLSQGLLKLALETRPDAVLLAGEGLEGTLAARPLELRTPSSALAPMVRSLAEAGIEVAMLVAPAIEAVKAVHGLGVHAVELFTGATVDLPPIERRARLEALADAARLAAKLHMNVSLGGSLDTRSLPEVLLVASSASRVAVGRALLARAVLVGLDRASRDFVALIR